MHTLRSNVNDSCSLANNFLTAKIGIEVMKYQLKYKKYRIIPASCRTKDQLNDYIPTFCPPVYQTKTFESNTDLGGCNVLRLSISENDDNVRYVGTIACL